MDPIAFSVEHQHEQIISYFDNETGLRAFLALHSTKRGPASGGTRIWHYSSTQEALLDALRLSEGMTYKAALAGLPLGGGNLVVLADGKEQDAAVRTARFRVLGRYIEALAGRFITMVDVGTTPEDMEQLRSTTRFVVGRPIEEGGSGEPSPMTALGVLSGMKALVEDVLERETLAGVRVAIQGLGKVGMNLAGLLLREGAAVIGSDVRPQAIEEARKRLEIEVIEPEAIYEVPCDVFAPCALGAVLNDLTIPRLRCRIVAGGANNQLEAERHAEVLQARQIVYAVDYVINVGGLINVAGELDGYDAKKVKAKTVQIYHTIKRMQEIARAEGITTQRAAQRMARAILEGASK